MSKYFHSGADFRLLDISSLKHWKKDQLSAESYKYFESELKTHHFKVGLEELLSQVEQSLKLPQAKLNKEQSLVFSLLIKNLGKYCGELHCDISDFKVFTRSYKKWSKILFEKAQNIANATEGKVGELTLDSNFVFGFQSSAQLQDLKRVRALHEFLEREEIQRQELIEAAKPKPPALILDLSELTRPKKAPLLVDSLGKSLKDSYADDEPKKRIKRNEIEKERNEMDIDTVNIGEPFVRNLFAAQESKQDLVILAKWMEVLN